MDILSNLDLLSVGIVLSVSLILGFAIYFQDRKNQTNAWFFAFVVTNSGWSIFNYLNYKIDNPILILWFIRLVLFFAILQTLSFFIFMYVFPKENIKFPFWIKYILVPFSIAVSFSTLTPYVFSGIHPGSVGEVAQPVVEGGIILFAFVAVFLVVAGVFMFLRKMHVSKLEERKPYKPLLVGVIIMFSLIIVFNLIFPVIFENTKFIPFSAFFIFPFIAFTAYSVYRNKLFNIKDIATIFLAFSLSIVTLLEILFSTGFSQIIFRSSVFILVLVFSIQLIRNMINLEHANTRLKELDQLKSEFVSLATHQIRAPLSAIKGYLSEIFEGDFGSISDELKKPLQIVFQSTENLIHIVGDFLNISRIEQGRMKYEMTHLNLKQVTADVLKELKPNIDRAGLELKFEVPEGNYEIYADIGKIKEVISNLIDNSLKYTPNGSIKVSLSSNLKTQKVLFSVADTGVGIPPEVIPKLFQKFTRAESANEINIIGTGLGLYVAKLIVEGQNGRIWAESPGTGLGSTFYVELPATRIS